MTADGAAPVVLDDFDSRPGSATSLVRTVVGAFLRDLGGRIATADLVALLGELGVGAPSARSAISRVKAKGVLEAAPVGDRPGYRLLPEAAAMLERGDRRIYSYRPQGEDDPWCVVSYSVPESRRDTRHRLRRLLEWMGCGHVATGLWICPAHLTDEVEDVLTALGVRDTATLFVTGTPRVAGTFADAAARWWDLDRVAALHQRFLDRHDGGPDGPVAGPEAFVRWTRALDDWRLVPYLDPGLPPSALPDDWPGRRGVVVFQGLRTRLAGPAATHVRSVVGAPD